MNNNERIFQRRLFTEVVNKATPGIVVRVRKKGKLVADVRAGKTYKYYDLASLTKILFTNTTLMWAVESKKIRLNNDLEQLLPWFHHRNISIRQLLTHSAGLTWWKPIYKFTKLHSSVNEKWELLKKILNSEKPRQSKTALYSDLDYFLLAFVLERVFQKPLSEIFLETQDHLNLSGLHFNVLNCSVHSKNLYAPTESCPWRKKTLRGEVHDDNTWALGGVSTHAGLFGSMDDVDQWFLTLRNSYLGKGPLAKKTVQTFWTRALPTSKGDWALGFMMPSKSSSSGRYFSKKSVGHTGFTGTSFWYDPIQDFAVTILSNRVHPSRDNSTFAKLRPVIHDWCWELFNT